MKILNKNKGFTLIEMLIATLIFSIVIGAAIGVFVSAIRFQKYNLTHQQILSQSSYAMEYMDRAIRMAKKDEIGCIDGSNYLEATNSIKFVTYHNQCWRFFVQNGQLKIDKDGVVYDLTSDDFRVIDFNVNVTGDSLGDNLQPKVTILIEIEGDGLAPQPKIKIQTTISQRNLDR